MQGDGVHPKSHQTTRRVEGRLNIVDVEYLDDFQNRKQIFAIHLDTKFDDGKKDDLLLVAV